MGLQALIFDVDGTLAETAEIHRAAFNQTFEEFNTGWCWDRQTYSYLLGMASDTHMLRAYNAISASRKFARDLSPETRHEMSLRKMQVYLAMLAGGAAYLRPGVSRLIYEARRENIALGIVSTRARIEYEMLVTNTLGFDALALFDATATFEQCGGSALNAYQKIIGDLGINPAFAIAIDDTESGIRDAAICGLKTVAAPGIYTSSGRFDAAEIVLSDLGRPAEPFDVISGNAQGCGFVSAQYLRELVGASRAAA